MWLYKNGFYNSALLDEYKKSGTWPDDGVQISEERYLELVGLSSTHEIKPDKNGAPIAVARSSELPGNP